MAVCTRRRLVCAAGARRGGLAAALATTLALGWGGLAPVLAGSVTASSIWDRENALQRARQQLPAGAVITREHCQVVEVGMGNERHLCTVEFTVPAAATPAPQPSPGGSNAPAP